MLLLMMLSLRLRYAAAVIYAAFTLRFRDAFAMPLRYSPLDASAVAMPAMARAFDALRHAMPLRQRRRLLSCCHTARAAR